MDSIIDCYVNSLCAPMTRKAFFSFHCGPDVRRAQVVRKSQFFRDHGEAGFYDASAFEKTKSEDPAALKRFLRKEIQGTSVICVRRRGS
jgi:MTH538 TIR-like domain (DUF1863)